MGKVRKGRRKLHTPKTSKQGEQRNADNDMVIESETTVLDTSPHPAVTGVNPFSTLRISKDLLLQKLPDFDTRSTVTSKSLKGIGLKKKEKQKLRHQLWMEKMNAVEADDKREEERRVKRKTPIVGDLTDLQETLPTLELLLKKTSHHSDSSTKTIKPKGIQKESKRKKRLLNDIAIFKQVLNHPSYKDNPHQTIHQHLTNKMLQHEEKS